eukprot:3228107-Amphidinium_carterae.1
MALWVSVIHAGHNLTRVVISFPCRAVVAEKFDKKLLGRPHCNLPFLPKCPLEAKMTWRSGPRRWMLGDETMT